MPDTGAPWNIPYVAGTDLVADWPTDSQTLATAIANGLDAAAVFGQIVSTAKLDTFSSTSATYTDVTGLSVTITPSTATNKVLLIAQVAAGFQFSSFTQSVYFRLAGGNSDDYIGDTAGNRERVAYGIYSGGYDNLNSALHPFTLVYLDSPATTGATTYSVQGRVQGATAFFINRTHTDTDNALFPRSASSITAIEVIA